MENYGIFDSPPDSMEDIISADQIVDQIIKELRENEENVETNELSFITTEYVNQIDQANQLPTFQQSFARRNSAFFTSNNNDYSSLPPFSYNSMEASSSQQHNSSSVPSYSVERYSSEENNGTVLTNDPNMSQMTTNDRETISIPASAIPVYYNTSEMSSLPVESLFQNYHQLNEINQPYETMTRPIASELNIVPPLEVDESLAAASAVLKITAPTFVEVAQKKKGKKSKKIEPEPEFKDLQYFEDEMSSNPVVVQYLNVNEEAQDIEDYPVQFIEDVNMLPRVEMNKKSSETFTARSRNSSRSSSIAKDVPGISGNRPKPKAIKIIRKEPLRTIKDLENNSNESDQFKFLLAKSTVQGLTTDKSPVKTTIAPRCRKRKQTFSEVAKNSQNWDEVIIESNIQPKERKKKVMTWDEFEASLNDDSHATSEKIKKALKKETFEDSKKNESSYWSGDDDLPLTYIPQSNKRIEEENYFDDEDDFPEMEQYQQPTNTDINGNECDINENQVKNPKNLLSPHKKLTTALMGQLVELKVSEKGSSHTTPLKKIKKLEPQVKPIIKFGNNITDESFTLVGAEKSELSEAEVIRITEDRAINTQKILLSAKRQRRHSTRLQNIRFPEKKVESDNFMAQQFVNNTKTSKIKTMSQSKRLLKRIQSQSLLIKEEKRNQQIIIVEEDPLRLLCQFCSNLVDDINSHYKECEFFVPDDVKIIPKIKADTAETNMRVLRNRSVKIETAINKLKRSNDTKKTEVPKKKAKIVNNPSQKEYQPIPVEDKKPQKREVVKQDNKPTVISRQFNLRSRNEDKTSNARKTKNLAVTPQTSRIDQWTCNICDRSFRKDSYLDAHLKTHDLTVCLKCSQTFPQFSLKRHIKKCKKA